MAALSFNMAECEPPANSGFFVALIFRLVHPTIVLAPLLEQQGAFARFGQLESRVFCKARNI